MVAIYILKCEGEHYYVGKSNHVYDRMEQHFHSTGSQWTKLHKPIRVLRVIPDCVDEDEDKFTKMMMRKYGIDKVRGGTYCQLTLDDATKQFIQRELFGASNRCYACGGSGHFVKDCPQKDNNIKTCDSEDNENDMEDLVKELKGMRDKIMDCLSTTKGTINVKLCKQHKNDNSTTIYTDAVSITYIRKDASSGFTMQGVPYKIVTTKRDMGIFSNNNYIIVEGIHSINPGTYVITKT